MSKNIELLTKKIEELCKLYESYAWREKNRKLVVVFQQNMTISFYLYENEELVDDIQLRFLQKEFDVYRAICLRTFAILLGNVEVHFKDNVYFNEKHKDYLGIIVGNEEVKADIDEMVKNQYEANINFNNPVIKAADKKIKRKLLKKQAVDDMTRRIEMSRNFLRGE